MSDLGISRGAEVRETSGPKNIIVTYDGRRDEKIIEYLGLRHLNPDSLVFMRPDELPLKPIPNTTLYLRHSPNFLGDDAKRQNWGEIVCFRFVSDRSGNIVNVNSEKVKDIRD